MKSLTILAWIWMLAFAAPDEKALKIESVQLAQSEDGTPVPADFAFLPGDSIFLSCHVSGYKREGDEPPKVFLTYLIEVRDPAAVLIVPIETGKIAADLSPEDRQWRPKIRYMIALPPLADSGQYQVIVKVKDEYGKVEAQSAFPLIVRGRPVPPSDTLIVRNFRFLRSEEDRDPLHDPAYRPGDTVWARFDMTGYKIGEKNRFNVEYGLKVLRPNGDLSFEEARAAGASDEGFYPQRYTPGILSLNLPRDLKPGEYTIVLSVRDNAGAQTFNTREKFTVE